MPFTGVLLEWFSGSVEKAAGLFHDRRINMKALKKSVLKKSTLGKLAVGGAVSVLMAMSALAFADPADDYRRGGFDLNRLVVNVSDRGYRGDRARRNDQRNDQRNRPITLRLDFNANGYGRVPLQRLLRNQHGINPSDWRIRSVNVRHKSRRHATAALRVGDSSSGRVSLRRGITTIYAPRASRGYSQGRWVLGYNNAKVRDVAVVLEPVRDNRRGLNRRNSSRDLAFNSRRR